MARKWSLLPVLVLALLSFGCFGLLSGGGEKGQTSFIVYNDVQPAATVTVVLRRGDKDVATLGTVPAGEERTLTYATSKLDDSFRLVAQQTSGASSVSRQFSLFDGAQVRWQIRVNNLSVFQ